MTKQQTNNKTTDYAELPTTLHYCLVSTRAISGRAIVNDYLSMNATAGKRDEF